MKFLGAKTFDLNFIDKEIIAPIGLLQELKAKSRIWSRIYLRKKIMKYDKQKFVDFLNKKWKGRECPVCNSGPWSVSDDIFEIRDYNNGNLILGGGPILPIIPVTCMNCGNTIFVNAILADAIKRNNGEEQNGK